MPVLNMQLASEALKRFYLPSLRYQLNVANPILAVIDRDKESVVGEEIRMALRYGRQGGIGNRADDGKLPTPNSRKTKQAKWDTKNIFARIHISDKTMRASRGGGGFVSLLEAELEDAQTDARDNLARQIYGDGSGKLATFAATTGTTLPVDDPMYFVEGMLIDVVSSGGLVTAEEREIISVDDDAKTITLKGAPVTTNAGDIATVFGNYEMELTGLGAIFTKDNELYGIDRSQNKWFNPTLNDKGGAVTEVGIQKMIDEVDRKAGGKTNFLISSYGVRRAYQDLLLATKRTTDVMQLKGGYDALVYNNMPFTVDKYCQSNTLYGLDLDTISFFHIMDWDWLDQDGEILHRVESRPVWEATLARYCDMGCSKPKGNWRMTGLIEK